MLDQKNFAGQQIPAARNKRIKSANTILYLYFIHALSEFNIYTKLSNVNIHM